MVWALLAVTPSIWPCLMAPSCTPKARTCPRLAHANKRLDVESAIVFFLSSPSSINGEMWLLYRTRINPAKAQIALGGGDGPAHPRVLSDQKLGVSAMPCRISRASSHPCTRLANEASRVTRRKAWRIWVQLYHFRLDVQTSSTIDVVVLRGSRRREPWSV